MPAFFLEGPGRSSARPSLPLEVRRAAGGSPLVPSRSLRTLSVGFVLAACVLLADGASLASAETVPPLQMLQQELDHEHGRISYYAERFAGRPTASGELFDPDAMTMAHPSLPFGTLVRVTALRTGRSVVLKVNDRGPFHGARIADVSPAAARLLGMIRKGLVRARLEVIDPILSPAAGSRQGPIRPTR